MYDNVIIFLPHIFNHACLIKNTYGGFRCQKLDNVIVSNENKKLQFMPLPNDYSFTCLKILQHVGLTEKLHIDADGFFYDLRVIFHYSTLIGTYHQKFQKMTLIFLHSKDTIS